MVPRPIIDAALVVLADPLVRCALWVDAARTSIVVVQQ